MLLVGAGLRTVAGGHARRDSRRLARRSARSSPSVRHHARRVGVEPRPRVTTTIAERRRSSGVQWHGLCYCTDRHAAVPRRAFLLLVLVAAICVAGCREEGDIQISSLEFDGVEQVDKGALANALQTKRAPGCRGAASGYFDRRAFEADLKRIEAFYRDRGFPDARVRSFDVKLNDAQDKVDITSTSPRASRYASSAIELTGFDVLPEDEQRSRCSETLPLQPGRPLDRQLAARVARARAQRASRRRLSLRRRDRRPTRRPAPRRRRVVARGRRRACSRSSARSRSTARPASARTSIRRQLTFKPGDRFTRREMRESQRKLYGLELFEFVNVESLEDPALQRRKCRSASPSPKASTARSTTGVGYGTEEQARARIRWDHVNFFGGAQQAASKASGRRSIAASAPSIASRSSCRSHFSLNFDGQAWQAAEPVYSLEPARRPRHAAPPGEPAELLVASSLINEYQRSTIDAGGAAGLHDPRRADRARPRSARPASRRGTLSARCVRHQPQHHEQPARRAQRLRAQRPRRAGRQVAVGHVQLLVGHGRRRATTCPLGRRLVLANRAAPRHDRSDSATSRRNVPFYKRFFLGGASSIRGWGRFEVEPAERVRPADRRPHRCSKGRPRSALPLCGKFGAVAFVDFGNVWSRAVGLQPRRSALRRRARPALPDADRPGALRRRLPAESDREPARQRRAASSGTGAFTSASARRS